MFEDMVVAERFNCQRGYGGLVSRSERVTVVDFRRCQRPIGHFTDVLAAFLNATYISNEYFNAGSLIRERRHNFIK